MFKFVLSVGFRNNNSHLVQSILYSTKQLPKNATQFNTKHHVNSIKSKPKQSIAINVEPLQQFRPTTFDEVGKIDSNEVLAKVELSAKNARPKNPIEVLAWQPTPQTATPSTLLNQYLMLSKIRLTTLVVLTTMVGYAMAPAPFVAETFLYCTIGTGLCSAAANSINQYHEVPFDAQMSRTKNRVLVRGLLSPMHAVNFAVASAAIGAGMLHFGVNDYAAALGLGNLLLYTSVYTPMKRFSIMNTWVGSVVGAIPPVIGWVGCSGAVEPGALLLAAILYTWQFPHFNALSWNLRPDYSRAGYRMMAVSHPALCRRVALRHTIALGILSAMSPLLDVTNIWFALETLPLNAYFAYLAYKFYQKSDSGSSRKMFRFSLIHLPALMILYLINKKEWIKKDAEKGVKALPLTTEPTIVPSITAVNAVM